MAELEGGIGVLGGTFDPPHIGHLVIAQEAVSQLCLSKIFFAPTRKPPHKLSNDITPIEHRLAMVQLAIAPHPRFALSRVDADRAGPTFTVDTMRLLREQFGNHAELFFIMGMDSLASILTWHAPDQLIRLCKLAVFNRPGFTANLDELESSLPGVSARVVFLKSPTLEIAASDIQRRVRAGQPIAQHVPVTVADYIARHNLYRD
ncbi:nicotinate-nucleotide adenylyltransferase [Anaerolineae bacterium]|nr:nicotinate-nucleotide adenylyltransferase [Anaerolineae bacterium]